MLMDLPTLITTVVLVTASGTLAPGPLFFATITHGTKSGTKGGLAISIGHALIEFPLVILLAVGLLTVANEPIAKLMIGVAGGLALLVFGIIQIRDFLMPKFSATSYRGVASRNPLLLGLVFTGLNPFFIVWWLTTGAKLVLEFLVFASLAGVVVMFVSHIWMDFAWLIAVAYLAKRGTNIIGSKAYRDVMTTFGRILAYFGVGFISEAAGLYLIINPVPNWIVAWFFIFIGIRIADRIFGEYKWKNALGIGLVNAVFAAVAMHLMFHNMLVTLVAVIFEIINPYILLALAKRSP